MTDEPYHAGDQTNFSTLPTSLRLPFSISESHGQSSLNMFLLKVTHESKECVIDKLPVTLRMTEEQTRNYF